MFRKEIKRKWLVDINKIDNIEQYNSCYIIYGYISQEYDTLSVRVDSNDGGQFTLTIKDSGLKTRNCIKYSISEEEYNLTILLSGNKIIKKKRYYIPSSFDKDRIISVDVYEDYDFIIAEYTDEEDVLVSTLLDEKYFIKEITDDESFYSKSIVYKKVDN